MWGGVGEHIALVPSIQGEHTSQKAVTPQQVFATCSDIQPYGRCIVALTTCAL